jgi:TrmH family RNA methyltransferase
MISSTSNPQIKNIIQLQKKAKARNEQGAFVIEGIKMFEESLEGGYLIKAYVSESFYNDKVGHDPEYFKHFSYEIVQDSILKEASDTLTPQGIMAIVKKPEYELETILQDSYVNLVLLEDLRDPGNLGTIVRTAEGAGVTGIILSKESVDMYNPKVIRSTMGAIYRMPFVYVDDFLITLKLLKENNITIYAAHLLANKYYDEISYHNKSAIMIGNEANGISDTAAKEASQYIKIPMSGKVESLNAAIAAAVLMYEIYRQKRK